jgi:hypothetical protein
MLAIERLTVIGSCVHLHWRYTGARGRALTGEVEVWTDEHIDLKNGVDLLMSGAIQLLTERLEAAAKG